LSMFGQEKGKCFMKIIKSTKSRDGVNIVNKDKFLFHLQEDYLKVAEVEVEVAEVSVVVVVVIKRQSTHVE